jgi:hypothetical protein
MTLSLYTAHVLLVASDLLPEDPETSYGVQVCAALVLAFLWRRTLGQGPLERVVAMLAAPARRAVAGPAVLGAAEQPDGASRVRPTEVGPQRGQVDGGSRPRE